MGFRKINTIGIEQANKVMHLSAIAYNLQKYLRFIQKQVKSGAGMQFYKKGMKRDKFPFLMAFKNQEITMS